MPPNNHSKEVQVQDYHVENQREQQQQPTPDPEYADCEEPPTPVSSPINSTLADELAEAEGPLLLEHFYHEKNIFITGGTGFVGKVLIEKLLYEFPTIGNIYVMVRPKSGQLIKNRLEEMTKCPVFDRIRMEHPERLEKLQPISGDIRFPGLGVNPLDLQLLIEKVSIIFHSAATIRFDEPLKYALTINTLGTKRVVQLAKKLLNLQAFVHVSTAYCTVERSNIEEKVYLEPIGPDKILEIADWMDDTTMNQLTESLYRGRPCSYHYTKSLAEHLLAQEVFNGYFQESNSNSDNNDPELISTTSPSNDPKNVKWRPFPVSIVRPSIITPSWRDPMPGWIDNYNGTTGFLVVSGKGVLRSMHVFEDYQCDMIPVDVVINTCILSAWYVAVHHYKQKFPKVLTNEEMNSVGTNDVFVVNCVSGSYNPITWSQIRDISMPLMYRYPSLEMFRLPGVRYHRSQLLNRINVYLEHTVPAYVIDFLFKFMGLSPILDQVYQKVHRATTALEFFTTNEWTYSGTNMLRLSEALKDSYRRHRCQKNCIHRPYDHKEDNGSGSLSTHTDTGTLNSELRSILDAFPVDLRQLKWQDYFRDYVLGIRRYLLKEDPSTIPQAQNQLFIMYSLTLFSKILVSGTLLYQLIYPKSMARNGIRMLMDRNQQRNSQILQTILR